MKTEKFNKGDFVRVKNHKMLSFGMLGKVEKVCDGDVYSVRFPVGEPIVYHAIDIRHI